MRRLSVLFFLVVSDLCSAQNRPLIDSLLAVVARQPDTVQTLTYAQLCWEVAKTDPVRARQYGRVGLALARKIGFVRGEIDNLHHIGICYGRQANYAEALRYSFRALPIAESLPDKTLLASVLRSIGALLSTQREYSRSIPILTRALHLTDRQTNQFEKTGILYFLGEAYIHLKQYPKGLALMKQSITLAQTQHQPYDYALALSGYAWGLQEQGRFAESVGYDQRCLAIQRAGKYTYGIANTLNRLSSSHYRLGKLRQAEQYGLQARATARQVGNWNGIKNSELTLFRIYTATASNAQADLHFSAFEAAQDSVFGQQRSQAIAEVETRYKLKLKDQQIAGLRQKTTLQQYLLWAGVAGGVLLLLVLALLYNRYRQRGKEKQAVEQQRQTERNLSLAQAQKMQLELKHRELACSALFAYQKNELLSELKQKVEELLPDADKVQRPKVTAIQKFIQSNLKFEEDWDAFRVPFEQVHPCFFEKLQRDFPDLTPNEQKLCAYTRINLSNKEIARLLNINTSSVEMSRYRMKKKMVLDGCESLTDFIQKR